MQFHQRTSKSHNASWYKKCQYYFQNSWEIFLSRFCVIGKRQTIKESNSRREGKIHGNGTDGIIKEKVTRAH